MSFSEVGPIIDGHVEVPLGSGRSYAADGMLSSHPDYPRLKEIATEHGVDIGRDVPLVLDHFAPLGMLYYLENVAFVHHRGMKIDRVFVVTPGTAQKVLDDMLDWRAPVRTAPIGLSGWLTNTPAHDWDSHRTLEQLAAGNANANCEDDAFELICTAPGYNAIVDLGPQRACYRCDSRDRVEDAGAVALCAACREVA